jgi:hypothetical protein
MGNKKLAEQVIDILLRADWSGGSWESPPKNETIQAAMQEANQVIWPKKSSAPIL